MSHYYIPKLKHILIGSGVALWLVLGAYAFDNTDAMEACMKRHSYSTCHHALNR